MADSICWGTVACPLRGAQRAYAILNQWCAPREPPRLTSHSVVIGGKNQLLDRFSNHNCSERLIEAHHLRWLDSTSSASKGTLAIWMAASDKDYKSKTLKSNRLIESSIGWQLSTFNGNIMNGIHALSYNSVCILDKEVELQLPPSTMADSMLSNTGILSIES